MAENEDGQEKTEEPSEKKLREARKKGQVPRSRELNTMMVTFTGALSLLLFGDLMINDLMAIMHEAMTPDRHVIFEPETLLRLFREFVTDALILLAPFFLLMLFVALISPALIGGWSMSGENLTPKLDRMDPIKGMKRVYSAKAIVELVKSLAKIILIGSVFALLFVFYKDEFIGLPREPLKQAIGHAGSLLIIFFVAISASLILIAAIDVPFQLWEYKKQLKMTKQEVKDEHKEAEGRPEIKQHVRQTQYDMSQKRMMEAVPKADVVVTNPTHYSVALKYEQGTKAAPKVVAKGKGFMALQIREVAEEHDILLFEAPLLARSIYFSTEIDREIPEDLYLAVAQVLAYVFQLQAALQQGGTIPERPEPEVPDDFVESLRKRNPDL